MQKPSPPAESPARLDGRSRDLRRRLDGAIRPPGPPLHHHPAAPGPAPPHPTHQVNSNAVTATHARDRDRTTSWAPESLRVGGYRPILLRELLGVLTKALHATLHAFTPRLQLFCPTLLAARHSLGLPRFGEASCHGLCLGPCMFFDPEFSAFQGEILIEFYLVQREMF